MGKILLLSPLPPPAGGIANWTKILVKKEKSENISLILLDTAVRWRNVANHSTLLRLCGGTIQALFVILKALKIMLLERPTVVHICTSGGFSFAKDLLVIYLAKVFGFKTLLHIRMGRLPELLLAENKEYKLFYLAFTVVDCCLVIDKSTFDALQIKFSGVGNYNDKIKLLSNFIDLEEVKYIDDIISESDEYINLIYVGHVIPTKGIVELFEAIKILDEPRIKLHVAGPYEKTFKEKLDLIGINDVVEYYGMVEKNRIFELINMSSALILPSYTEGFPNVVLEAMTCEKAVLATNVGAIPEMLNINSNNACGICFNPKSTDEIVLCLRVVLQDKNLLKVWGKNARKRVEEEYSTDIIIPKLNNIWNNL